MIDYIQQGDCLDLMKNIPDKSIDMILCDLPYGTTRNKWDSIIPLEPLWEQYERIIKDRGAIVLTAQTPFDKVLGASNLERLRYEWIWDKKRATGFLNARKMPLKQHENILVFYKKLPTYNPQYTKGESYTRKRNGKGLGENYSSNTKMVDGEYVGKRFPKSIIIESNADGTNRVHPTQKPVALFEYLIKTYTNEGETVLDDCMGSGTTIVAAINTNRHYIGFEMEQKYFDIAEQRIKDAKNKIEEDKLQKR